MDDNGKHDFASEDKISLRVLISQFKTHIDHTNDYRKKKDDHDAKVLAHLDELAKFNQRLAPSYFGDAAAGIVGTAEKAEKAYSFRAMCMTILKYIGITGGAASITAGVATSAPAVTKAMTVASKVMQ
jgi:hypothetical protein